ncbi:hypothetical protein QBC32DRAFT_380631 [Pseudoneurospora amorphoporcata]|uniref:Uncharacterized protein n=1 Tax=Pseudoneurospora amorphoporcata TaxID=241081 RepID=A0AAN6NML4_9PEZI|nr:hypothetical protein QBC32DRAFT_380631 [Pseudoneurospora amorphoporcata]
MSPNQSQDDIQNQIRTLIQYIQNQAQATQNHNPIQTNGINGNTNPAPARQVNMGDLFNPVNRQVNNSFDLIDLVTALNGNAVNPAYMYPASQVNPVNNQAPIDPANLFNGGPVGPINLAPAAAITNTTNAVLNGNNAITYFHTHLNAIPVQDTLGQRSLVLSGLRFQDPGDWHVYIQLVHTHDMDGQVEVPGWWIDAGVVKVVHVRNGAQADGHGPGLGLDQIGTGPYLSSNERVLLRRIGKWW